MSSRQTPPAGHRLSAERPAFPQGSVVPARSLFSLGSGSFLLISQEDTWPGPGRSPSSPSGAGRGRFMPRGFLPMISHESHYIPSLPMKPTTTLYPYFPAFTAPGTDNPSSPPPHCTQHPVSAPGSAGPPGSPAPALQGFSPPRRSPRSADRWSRVLRPLSGSSARLGWARWGSSGGPGGPRPPSPRRCRRRLLKCWTAHHHGGGRPPARAARGSACARSALCRRGGPPAPKAKDAAVPGKDSVHVLVGGARPILGGAWGQGRGSLIWL